MSLHEVTWWLVIFAVTVAIVYLMFALVGHRA